MNKILITGGNGFLGSNTVRRFNNMGYQVMVLAKNSDRISDILCDIEFIKCQDSYTAHKQSILKFSPNFVLDFAWVGGNKHKDIHDINQYQNNIPRSVELLSIISELSDTRFIGVGSFSEYGRLTKPATEDDQDNPISCYGLSKNIVKNISKLFCEQNKISWTWIRPCYVYGPGDVPSRLIPSVISKLLVGDSIVLGSCRTTIDYLYIDDFCNAIRSIVEEKIKGVVNICSNNEYCLFDIITDIQRLTKNNSVQFCNEIDRKFSSNYICGSNAKLKNNSNWIPSVDIRNGLMKTIDHNSKEIL
jgi:dTDP-6-deoxy-L-talose 4-dehydrogenase (NAD+)